MQRARDVASQGRGLLGKVMGPFMGMATKAFDAVQSRVSQAVNMVKTVAQRGKDVALKVGRKIADTTPKAGNLLKDFTQSAIQKGRQALQTAKQWSSQQIKTATELGSRWVTQARKGVADLVRNGVKLAKEKAIPFIKQKLGGVKHRIKDFLQDKWNRLKEKLGIKKPGKEGPKGGAKETPDTAAKKAAELPAAIAQAKAITKANDAVDTPVPALLGVLNASVKSRYSWIKRFEARPKAVPGHYSIHMIASDHDLGDYTTRGGGYIPNPPLRPPNRRHNINTVNQKTVAKEMNTMIEPGIDVAGDVAAINAGKATREGNTFIVNGRTYGMHDGILYPISGPGFHQLERGAFKALGVYNVFGDTPKAAEILDKMGMSEAHRQTALNAWRAGQGGK